MANEIDATSDTINPALGVMIPEVTDPVKQAATEEAHVATGEVNIRGSKSDTRRLLRGLSAKEGAKVDPKALPKNNLMAMYKLMFQAARTLKEFVELERKEMKESNKNWKKHSESRAECSDKAYDENERYAKYTGAIMSVSILSHGLTYFGFDRNTTASIAQILQGFSGTVQQWSEGTNQKTTSAATKADYSKDSSRSDFDMTRDEMRQLEQAVDQIHSQLIELMRLEAKAYSREGG